ncbi:MAG: hypothetical protein ACRYFV_22685 [Janthinobacterium lividum]|jgi:hypothetical protein
MVQPVLRVYFENPVGRLLEQPVGGYLVVEYYKGPRKLSDLQAFLTQAGQLLALRGWDRLIANQGQMPAFTLEEADWVSQYWLGRTQQRPDLLHGAMLLPHDVFERLSWRSRGNVSEVKTTETLPTQFD